MKFTSNIYWKRLFIVVLLCSFSLLSKSQSKPPITFGYCVGTNVPVVGDSMKVSFNGGALRYRTYQSVNPLYEENTVEYNGEVLQGFPYGLVYAPNAFDKDIFVSKGYFPDYVELSWEIARFQDQVTAYKVFRKELGSLLPFELVANLNGSATSWKDEYAESGTMYEYKLLADGLFPSEKLFLNILTGIGFRIPSGKVSGRVTYEGGGAVNGVALIAETTDNFDGTSLQLNGTDAFLAISHPANDPHFKLNSNFTFQGWFKPTSTSTSTLFQKGSQYKITHSDSNVTLYTSKDTLSLDFSQKADTFFQITAVRALDSLRLYVMYDNATIYKASSVNSGSTPSNNNDILIGKDSANSQYYAGLIDEIRIWHRALPESEIIVRSFMYIPGTEDSLSAYYRLNEGVGNNFFDLSRKGFSFNEKHGGMSSGVTWSTTIPTRTQLAVKGYTDANGNYLISGVPYTSDGSTYRIVPAFGVHSFEPTERLMFIGPGSNVYSDVNFVDVASFLVSGKIFYKNTRFPVSGVQVKIDDVTAVKSDGTPITSDANGEFKMDVPIGKHQLKLVKFGHVFKDGGYFPDSLTTYDFQQPFEIQQNFLDTTLIKVVGKVVGGPVEAEKALGMGRAVNNIGNAKIVMTTQREWDLKDSVGDVDGTNENLFFHHIDSLKTSGTTTYSVKHLKPKEIEIRPDDETGEYFAYLLPEKYVIKSIVAGNPDATTPKYTFDNSFHTVLDLSNSYSEQVAKDSILDVTDFTINPKSGDTVYAYLFDSVHYNLKKDFILRVNPTVTMTSPDLAVERFWEEKINVKDGSLVTIVSSNDYGDWLTPKPVFVQRNKYKTKIKVFEQYENIEKGKIDNVPVIDGVVRIQNGLAIQSKIIDYDLNEQGEYAYDFTGGLPNLSSGGLGDFQKSMTVKVFTGKAGSIVTDWPAGGGGFQGYVFGGMPTGNNFVSTGPNIVSMIIRDPHGSNSYAFYEEGNTSSTEYSYSVEDGESSSLSIKASFGMKQATYAGTPVAGVIVAAETKLDATVGLAQTTNWVNDSVSVVTTTNTKKWSTSSEPDFVGANGDVFIGNSTNIVYGKNVYVELLAESQCDAESSCIDALVEGGNTYKIGIYEGLRLSPEFNTGFQYSQNHIENYLIPQLEELRNNFYLKKQNSENGNGVKEYVCVVCSGEDYGKSNTANTLIRRTDTSGVDGDSYNINYPITWSDTTEYIDSVSWYNSQITSWENILAQNENEKVNAETVKNYSYDAGTILESSTTVESSTTETESFVWTISPSLKFEKGFDIAGVGLQTELNIAYNHQENESTSTTNSTVQTFGFVFNDGDEGDFYSIDVKDANSGKGPIFSVRGGQSQCPYVDAEKTKYQSPIGTVYSEATMKIEVPKISVKQSIVNNVPQGSSANYLLYLSNESETGDEAWYRLSIDESSIVGGTLKIDGAPITNGRTFFLPAGETLVKTLNLSQAIPDSFRFENVRLVFHSLCQFDPGDNWEDISDTVEISAYFQPACSEITINNPDDLWLINTSDINYSGTEVSSIPLNVGLRNYNLEHSTFERIAVQYKSTSSSQWVSDMVYYKEQTDFDLASEPKTFINSVSQLDYVFEMKSLQDRNYDVRLQTQCADGTVNTSETVTGIKDVKRPKLFGTPQPGDGILSPGDDIMVTFDEDVQAGLLTSFNFTVKGVLNGAEIAHNSVLFFDGVDDNASVIEGVNLTDKSFTIEFWTERLSNNAGVIISEGDLEIGFNSSNNIYIKIGDQTVSSSNTYTTGDDWMHFAVAFDYRYKRLSCYMNDQIAIDNVGINGLNSVKGRMYVGQNMTGANHYNGYIHDLRVWETLKGFGSVVANMNVSQTGDKVGLSGFWPMDEASGKVALDLSRSHHALLNGAAWVVFPRGYARSFNGTSDNIAFNSGEVIVTNEMDMTIEFWMKANTQSNSVIFSNGRGDKSDSSPPYENIWVMGADSTGKLYAMNNGAILTVDKDVFDNEWHHIAVVVKRIANTTIYVDGNQEVFNLSSNFGGLSGAKMSLGGRQFKSGSLYTYDQYFNGRVDEFRVWKLAKTKKLIDLDKNAKLKGDEIGLLAYYPFDTYNVNLVIEPTLLDQVEGSSKNGIADGTTTDNMDVPNIKDARPVQKVRYNWVVNEDQIILNIEEDPELIENVVLEITAQDIEDLNENRLASPVAWTAYIKKNTVLWNQTSLFFEKKLDEKVTFTVDVLNLGGTEQNYEITNLPSWLSLNEATGTLSPDSRKTLIFEVSESTNIGEYDQSIYLGSDFGFKEKLEISLKVKGDAPDWEVDPEEFQYSMSVIGTLNINGVLSVNEDDQIAAFVNTNGTYELRGVSNLRYVESYDIYEFFLDIYSDSVNYDSIEFRVWNASEGKIQVDVTPELSFRKDSLVGLPSSPQEFVVTDNVITAYVLKKGWNWVSFNLNSTSLVGSNKMFEDLNVTDGDLIKTQGKYDQFGSTIGWIGEISKQGGFDFQSCYKMKVDKPDTLYVVGASVKPDTIIIPLDSGWTWLGYPAESNMSVNDAMGNSTFQNGDFVKGQAGFAVYDQYLGWIGSLKYLEPTKGYMIKTSTDYGSFSYPDPYLINSVRKGKLVSRLSSTIPWSYTKEGFSNDMSFIVELDICHEGIDLDADYLGVFVDDECRGVIKPEYISALNKYFFFLSAYANTSGESLEFKYYDGSASIAYELNETYTFSGDKIVGTTSEPYPLTLKSGEVCKLVSLDEGLVSSIRVYPNPFDKGITIKVINNEQESVRWIISDVSGREIQSFSTTTNTVNWDGTNYSGIEVSQGVYFISVYLNDQVYQTKVIKN